LLFSLKHVSLQAPPWCDSLRQVGFISAAAATTYRPIRGATLISIIGGGGWDQRLHSRRWRSLNVDGILLMHLFFFIEIDEDDDFAIIRWPKNSAVKVVKEYPGELLIL
jgi:hypothetical protein